jgi:transposase InsO family protein
MVGQIRALHPAMGGRKLYAVLQSSIQQQSLDIGRDGFFDLLRENSLLIRKKRRKTITTWSKHPFRKYRNLVKDFIPTAPNQLWVSDITYLKTKQGFLYIFFITDAYSRKIVGYDLADNLESVNALQALHMAIQSSGGELSDLIHHSDRGIQYCSHDYVNLLNHYAIRISMTENGDPLENAIAERINGIIKHEYLSHQTILNKQQAILLLEQSVNLYNNERPHLSCNMLTPDQIHLQHQLPKRLWKNYYKKKATLVNQ